MILLDLCYAVCVCFCLRCLYMFWPIVATMMTMKKMEIGRLKNIIRFPSETNSVLPRLDSTRGPSITPSSTAHRIIQNRKQIPQKAGDAHHQHIEHAVAHRIRTKHREDEDEGDYTLFGNESTLAKKRAPVSPSTIMKILEVMVLRIPCISPPVSPQTTSVPVAVRAPSNLQG